MSLKCNALFALICITTVAEAEPLDVNAAQSFLAMILTSDFRGENVERLGRVVYSSTELKNVQRSGPDKMPPRTEMYFLDADPLVVVSSWRILEAPRTARDEVRFRVEFQVLCLTQGIGVPSWFQHRGRALRCNTKPKTSVVEFTLRYVKGQWDLFDPPEPRVSADALKTFFEHDLDQFRAVRTREVVEKIGPHAVEDKRIHEKWVGEQLKLLAPFADQKKPR